MRQLVLEVYITLTSRYGLGDQFLDPFKEAVEICRQAELPCHLTHFYQKRPIKGSAEKLLGLVEDSRDEGLDVTFDSYPYPFGSTRFLIVIPDWAHDGGPDKLKEVLASPEGRKRLRGEVRPRGDEWDRMWLTYFKKPHNKKYEGRSIGAIAEETGKEPVEFDLRSATGRRPSDLIRL